MEIKNFADSFSSGRAKILTAVFVCTCALVMVGIFLADNYSNKDVAFAYEKANICGVVDGPCTKEQKDLWGCDENNTLIRCSLDGNYKWESYKANYMGCDLNNPCEEGANSSDKEEDVGAAGGACSGGDEIWGVKSNQCAGSNQYCFGGVCDYGCAIAENDNDNNSANDKFVKLGGTTCEKPSYFSVDGVYECKHITGESAEIRKGDGGPGESKPASSSYALYPVETCYSGCSDGACKDESTCTGANGLANQIISAFSCYRSEVVNIANGYNNDINKTLAGMTVNEAKNEAKNKYNNIRTTCNIPTFVALEAFEKLAYPNGQSPIISAASGVRFSVATSITQNDILCAYNSDIGAFDGFETICGGNSGKLKISGLENRKCAGEDSLMSPPFKGRSYECKKLGSCYVYSWLSDGGVEKCPSTNTDVFTSGDYFKQDKNGYPFDGWGVGSEDGCEYVSYASLALGDSENPKNKNLNYYYENKTFTGFCSNSSNASIDASALGTCTAYASQIVPGGEVAEIISYEIHQQTGDKQIEHIVQTSESVSGCAIAAGSCQKIGTSVKNKVQKDLSLITANQQTGEKTFGLSEGVGDWLADGELPVQVSCTVDCGDQQKTATVTVQMGVSDEQANCCLYNNVWYAVGESICDGNTSKACAKGQKQIGNQLIAEWVDEKCEITCDSNTGKCEAGCWSSSAGKYYNFGEYKCGNCAYEGSSAYKIGSCLCDRTNGWVLQAECETDKCDIPTGKCVDKDLEQGLTFKCDRRLDPAVVMVFNSQGVYLNKIIKSEDECDAYDGQDRANCKNASLSCERIEDQGDCLNTPKSCSLATDNCYKLCGSDWKCVAPAINLNVKGLVNFNITSNLISSLVGKGVCFPEESKSLSATTCKLNGFNNINTPSTNYSSCDGAYVKFVLNSSGDCANKVYCEVTNDYSSEIAEAQLKSTITSMSNTSNWVACVPIQSRYGDSQNSSASIPDKIHFYINCSTYDDSGNPVNGETACDNPFKTQDEQKKEEEGKSEEGGTCKKEEDCREGLVCVDGKCITEEDAQEQEEQNNTAPSVNISAPSGTIDAKTAELKVSTDIAASCKYMLGQDGSFSNFDGGGMTMGGSGGTSHTATLSNLTNTQASDCKYNHTVTVMCKNSKAGAGATGAVGSAQTSFSVDLSQKTENAPVVSSASDSKHTIANPILKVITDRPADCEYKEGNDFTSGGGTKFDTTGSYSHNTQLDGLENDDYVYYVVCKDKETCAANKPGFQVNFEVDLSGNPENAPNIVSTTPEIQTVANPTLSVTTDRPAICQYKADYTFTYDGGTQFSNDGEYAHSAPLADLDDGEYTFHVACKDKSTGAAKTLEIPIVTTLDRGRGAPAITSTTPETQTMDNPELSVTTDRPAICQYKKDYTFTYGSGTSLDSGDKYSHKISLEDLDDGTYKFYVACQTDVEKGAAKTLESPINTTLERDGATLIITNNTANSQNTNKPTISAATNIAAVCQYKSGSDFTFGLGLPFAVTGGTSHSVQLSDVSDGTYTYYVVCQNPETKDTTYPGTQIVFTVNISANAPVISNTTPASQNTSSPALSVITNIAAVCQYQKDADFVYGQGVQFVVDGGTGHSVVLNGIADGAHTYYVVCRDPATQVSNSPGAQIMFSVNTASEVCASLSSNDKQNDNDRDYSDDDDYNSVYLWRSVAAGTVESFDQVDWFAGYQFTPEENGYVTQLCGYFDSGSQNEVGLYDGSYDELAAVEIDGEDGWNCANIAPVKVKADKRYYVIARVQDDPIYFAYKSGLLPRDAENAVIEAGVRQLASSGDFGENLKKYDYMVFGLVDAKIRFAEDSEQGPEISDPLPDGNNEESDTVLSAQTDENAACKFDRQDAEYKDMKYTFGATGQMLHQQKICDLDDGPFTWYVRCKGATETNDESTLIQFDVDD